MGSLYQSLLPSGPPPPPAHHQDSCRKGIDLTLLPGGTNRGPFLVEMKDPEARDGSDKVREIWWVRLPPFQRTLCPTLLLRHLSSQI